MQKLLAAIAIFFSSLLSSQTCTTLVRYDYIETYNWSSGWNIGSNGGYYTNVAVTPTLSAAVSGSGNGSSAIESGFYILPNITGLNTTSKYVLSFRLASYRFSNPTAATAGVDVSDYTEVQLSTNGGGAYVSELRITGNANAHWTYSSTAVATKTANGTLTTLTPGGGGDRTSTGDGYSYIQLTLPAGVTQCAFYIYCRVNSVGEEWWLDNIELFEIFTCSPLPIELISFDVTPQPDHNLLTWKTLTELNNDYFVVERSTDAVSWNNIFTIKGAGTSVELEEYEYRDYYFLPGVNYYRLHQVDFDGKSEYFNIVSTDRSSKKEKKIIKIVNAIGCEIPENSTGLLIYYYSDGTYEKVVKY